MKTEMKSKPLLNKEEIDLENQSTKQTAPTTSKSKTKTNNAISCSKANFNHQQDVDAITNKGSIKSNANKNDKNNKENNQDLVLVNNEEMHKFYTTRLKHSLIIRFLLLVPIQNLSLCLISQFSENVS
jgi:hypothetical protein